MQEIDTILTSVEELMMLEDPTENNVYVNALSKIKDGLIAANIKSDEQENIIVTKDQNIKDLKAKNFDLLTKIGVTPSNPKISQNSENEGATIETLFGDDGKVKEELL